MTPAPARPADFTLIRRLISALSCPHGLGAERTKAVAVMPERSRDKPQTC
jgi:hypothetical protein